MQDCILLDEQRPKCLIGYWTISDRIMLVKLKGKPFDNSIIQVYAPTADKSEEEHEQFYNDLGMAKSQCKSQDIVIVMGDFNPLACRATFLSPTVHGRSDNVVVFP